MTHDEKIFLEFLRAGIWNRAPQLDHVLDNAQWQALLNMSMKQTVMGLVFDSVSLLPVEFKPPRRGMMWWLKYEMKLVSINKKLEEHALQVGQLFKAQRVTAVMVKGLAVAEYYPSPLHRQSGDIDLWVPAEQYQKACQAVKSLNPSKFDIRKEHANAYIDDWVLEIHSSLTHSHLLPVANRAHRWLQDNVAKTDGELCDLGRPNKTFHTVFVFFHFFQHFIQSGAGFRQLCDWCMCLHATKGMWDEAQLERDLHSIGLLKPWLVFGYIVGKYMGVPLDEIPLYRTYSDKKAERVMEAMFDEGNFGYHSEKRHRVSSKNYLAFRLSNLDWKRRRFAFLISIFPGNTLRSLQNPFDLGKEIIGHYKEEEPPEL